MTLDKQEHKIFLLEMFNATNFPGKVLDLAHEVKESIKNAEVAASVPPPDRKPK